MDMPDLPKGSTADYLSLRYSHPKWLVLRLLDTRGLLAENAAFDSFACGFQLALELTTESQQYQEERSEEALAVLCATEENEDEN